MSNSPSKSTRINGNLIVETYGNSLYHCNYKSKTIQYPDLKVNETKTHTIYESLNDIQYNILKYWFYNHNNNKNRYNIELAIDCIEYLKNRDFFDMNHFDKVLLMIIYNELKKIHV
jgi:hypothetical protein